MILSAEKISKGFKAKELVKILSKAKIAETGIAISQNIDDNKMAQILSTYLSGWEHHYQLDFQHPKQDTMTKISGLRYIMLLFSTFTDIAVTSQRKFEEEMLDDMHERKIDMADEFLVIDEGGYIGSSTKSEIKPAIATGKIVKYLEEV